MTNREKATNYWLSLLDECDKGNKNIEIYKKYFESLSDKEFEILMHKVKDGSITLPYYAPNVEAKDVPIDVAIKIGKKLGINFFQRIIKTTPITGVKRLTPVKYMILNVFGRRQAQHVLDKRAIAKHTKNIDNLSGQVIGVSKTAKLSQPEILNMNDQNLHNSIYELAGVRGGNINGLKLARRNLIEHGEYSLEEIQKTGNRAESIETANTILRGMHYESNL